MLGKIPTVDNLVLGWQRGDFRCIRYVAEVDLKKDYSLELKKLFPSEFYSRREGKWLSPKHSLMVINASVVCPHLKHQFIGKHIKAV